MRALVFAEKERPVVKEVPRPEPGEGEVLVRMEVAGVCATDYHLLKGGHLARFPLIPGHELVGRVEALGPKVAGLRVGERVAVHPVVACGACVYCRKGLPQHCLHFQALGVTLNGGFAEYLVAPAKNLYPVGDLPPERAVFAEPLGCVLWGLARLGPILGEEALVFGAGPIGLLLLQGLLLAGATRVYAVDPVAERRDLARALGAAEALSPQDLPALREAHPLGFGVVAEATGRPEVVEAMPSFARRGGRILIFGVHPEEAKAALSPYEIYARDLSVIGSFSLPDNLAEALAYLREGRVRVEPLVSEVVPLEALPDHFQNRLQGRGLDRIKTLVRL
ncbi:zinc-dependent alcohol dehydrogenase family protein (plasmid) [Thermus thermophilus]|uniref:zinc-dependent alcohol dehydrogenase family protein n=1 Tax=Thermus thermophilus TaxID=274 RepID=UPI0030E3F53B